MNFIKLLRRLIIVIFVLSLVGFVFYRVQEKRTSDFVAPVITADKDHIDVSVDMDDAELLKGLTAKDNLDGDVTDTIVVASKSKFSKKGTLNINYAAFDNNNNVGTYTRELTYTDYRSPRFSLSQPLVFLSGDTANVGKILDFFRADDVLDGDITEQIMITSGDTYTINEDITAQKVNLQVSNSAGDTVVLEVDVRFMGYNAYNLQTPNLNQYILYTKVGDTPEMYDYIDGIRRGTNYTSFEDSVFDRYKDIEVDTSGVDFTTPGAYQAYYTLSRLDEEEDERIPLGTAVMIIVVEDMSNE